jgi:hypothetical protein
MAGLDGENLKLMELLSEKEDAAAGMVAEIAELRQTVEMLKKSQVYIGLCTCRQRWLGVSDASLGCSQGMACIFEC